MSNKWATFSATLWVALIVMLALVPMRVVPEGTSTDSLKDLSLVISLTPEEPKVGEYVAIAVQLFNNGSLSITYNYSFFIDDHLLETGKGRSWNGLDCLPCFIQCGWTFDRPGVYQVRVIITEVNGTGELRAWNNVTVAPNSSYFSWSSGSLKSLRPLMQLVPCKSGVGFFVYGSLINTGDSDLVVNYTWFGGFGNPIGNGSDFVVPPAPNNRVFLNHTYWAADPTGNGMYPLGINITDMDGTGRLVQYLVITVNEFSGNGTGPLCGVVCVQPEANVGECVTVRVLLSNVGNTTLHDISYLISAGLGNSQASGDLGDLSPGALCQSAPDGIFELHTEWTPSSGGIYLVAINASDPNSSAVFTGGVDVAVSGPGMGRLATVIQIGSDAVELGENTTITCILRNTGYAVLYNVHYEIYAGLGNQLMNGTVAELSSGALCQSAPASMVVLHATWTPTETGAYEVGINASDANGSSYVASHVTKNVVGPIPIVRFSISPSIINATAGSSVNATVSIWYTGGMMSTIFSLSKSTSMPNIFIFINQSTAVNCRIAANGSEIRIWNHADGIFYLSFTVPIWTAEGNYSLTLSVKSYRENINAVASMKINVHPTPTGLPDEIPPSKPVEPATYTGFALIALAGVVALVIGASTEYGLVALLTLLIPLYSKLHKEEVLDQFTRGKIQGYITAYPGEHYNSIKTQLGLNNGVLAYHLRVLEREGYVTSLRDGVYKRFYPKETPLPKKRGQFSAIQEMIIEHIRSEPGISQDGLAQQMKVSNQVIYYHIRTLMAAGAVRLEKSGKETHCYLNDSGGSGSYAGLSF
jgi:predicted transcriptional regulator